MLNSNSVDGEDLLLKFGARHILQSQLNKIKFSEQDVFREDIKRLLTPFFEDKITSSESRIFIVKIWTEFSPSQYGSPDYLIKIPLQELAGE